MSKRSDLQELISNTDPAVARQAGLLLATDLDPKHRVGRRWFSDGPVNAVRRIVNALAEIQCARPEWDEPFFTKLEDFMNSPVIPSLPLAFFMAPPTLPKEGIVWAPLTLHPRPLIRASKVLSKAVANGTPIHWVKANQRTRTRILKIANAVSKGHPC